jgi:CheY-like chemotaxis protein
MPTRRRTVPILVVDDDPAARDVLIHLLESEGYEVATAGDGEQALACMRRCAPALVLLDLMLPVMDGFEFRVRQMQDPALADIPVIVFTGGEDVDKATGLHAAACLRKPVDAATLLEAVRAFV